MKINRVIFGIICFIALNFAMDSLFAADPESPTRRFGIFIGSNNGGSDRNMLNYAVTAARSMSNLYNEMRMIDNADSFLLLDTNISEINMRFDEIHRLVASSRAVNMRTEIVFYYAGHSDEEGFLLNREKYSYSALNEQLSGIPVDMRIVIVDSCASGAFARIRSGGRSFPFLPENAEGFIFLTSVSDNETTQETSRIESSFFTHSIITGLRGAADSDGDGQITLNELNRFANAESLVRPEISLAGMQRSSFDIQARGSNWFVMSNINRIASGIVFDGSFVGRLSIRNNHNHLIAEFTKAERFLELGLIPGRYRITLDHNDKYLFAEATVVQRSRSDISILDFLEIGPDDNISLYTFFYNETYEPFPYPTIGFINRAIGDHRDFQLGLVNINTENLTGFQAAFINTTGREFSGFQAGFVNTVGLSFSGFQYGFINSNGNTNGYQAGFVNSNYGNTNGFQTGFLNITSKIMTGVQLGFINYAESYESGIPIGFLSIVKNGGYQAIEYSVSSFSVYNIGFKIGIEWFYSAFYFSNSQLEEFSLDTFAVGFGFGSIIPLFGNFLYLNPEISYFYPLADGENMNYASFSLNFGVAIGKFSILFGPTLTWFYSTGWFSGREPLGEFPQFFDFYSHSIDDYNRIVIGARVALRFRF